MMLDRCLRGTLVCFLISSVASIESDFFDSGLGAQSYQSHQQVVFHPPPTAAGSYFGDRSPQFNPFFPYDANTAGGGSESADLQDLGDGSFQVRTGKVCTIAPPAGPCTDSKYRTMDGSCNNLANPGWGVSNTRYGRLLPPNYSDGRHKPAVSVTGQPLPSARLISIVLFPDVPIRDPLWTLITMTWGQAVTHDMSMAMGTTQAKPHANQCCSPDGRLHIPPGKAPASCFTITIPKDDPVYARYGQQCMNFLRSTTDVGLGCAPHSQPHEQIATVTHWMDASLVYGQSNEKAASLREGAGGRLSVEYRGNRYWPPPNPNKTGTCETQTPDEACYNFGDVRGNQNPGITIVQITFIREHNRIADTLAQLNPHWDDETLYQEARRIVIAEMQHISYYEWLPIILGTKNLVDKGLIHNGDQYVDDYREDVQPNVLNEHAQGAFRYFHSSIQGQLELIDEHRMVTGVLRLSDTLNRPAYLELGDHLHDLTRGMTTQSQEGVDPFFTSEQTDFLFRNGKPFGQDLRALDIQRGRDHGIASYNSFRQFCGLPKANKWEDLGDWISKENIDKLSLLYASVDDVDYVVGGSLEAHLPDTLSGPSYFCVLMEQFYRTRVADRYFYESSKSPGAFTPDQLRELKKSSVSRLLCDNTDHIQVMQPHGFRVISNDNPLVSCDDTSAIPAVDLSFWKAA